MASFSYLHPANANLVCCICRSPFVEPCTTRTCSHTFCYDCIAQAIAINRQCPIDRTPLSINHLAPADPVIRNLVDELIVRCPQHPLGCSYTCQRLLLPGHLKHVCQYVHLPCPDARCSLLILRRDIKNHQCSDPATRTSAASDNSSETHSCQNSQDKPTTSASPSSASRAPAGDSTSDLAAENAMLRLRLTALENVVHTLRNEMFAVKYALGPWYRPDAQSELPPDDQPEDLEATAAFEHQLAQDLAAVPTTVIPETISSSASRDPVDIASYFPPPEEATPQATTNQNRHRNTSSVSLPHLPLPSAGQGYGPLSPLASSYPSLHQSTSPTVIYASSPFPPSGQTPAMPYSQGTSFSATSPSTFSIPPLDPTTSLPDTLATLHSSMVTLSGAHGALAAARAAESLRTTEELRGLRAAMHGLRMQVHDILTSRTHLIGNGVAEASENSDANEPTSPHLGRPGWTGFGLPRPYGMPPVHHSHYPPSFGGPVIPPTNITKL
ncbi:hypothetical protein GSI_03954 [Ganoderma sinense ZZ0214-1]|uniref:RING-type domain-containing protein n=1 Tax=Ganoderma sinense ZZ0214-1 TaxID=1077348 RepID=A0A2G8SKG2_9APHY|nr:hypothetical protein GSI_03954 [Ganoderma sinense ZZ0214-1]